MRAIWHRIHSGISIELAETIDLARSLCPLQTAAGLHQAVEASLLGGVEAPFWTCYESLVAHLRDDDRQSLRESEGTVLWGQHYSHLGARIYREATGTTGTSDADAWQRSDPARKLYYESAESEDIGERIELLRGAAKLFAQRGLKYREQMCLAESEIWKVSQERTREGLVAQVSLAREATSAIKSLSPATRNYKRMVSQFLDMLEASSETGSDVLQLLSFQSDSRAEADASRGGSDPGSDQSQSASNPRNGGLESLAGSWYAARFGGLTPLESERGGEGAVWSPRPHVSDRHHPLREGSPDDSPREVFICYNRRDEHSATRVVDTLQAAGRSVWFDRSNMELGYAWREVLEQALDQAAVAIVCIGDNGLGRAQRQEIAVLLEAAAQRQLLLIPVILEDAGEKIGLPSMLRTYTVIDLREQTVDRLEQLVAATHRGRISEH